MAALVTFDLKTTSHVHTFVAAQVGKLRVSLEADLTSKGLHARMDVRMLLEARRGGKGLTALGTSVRTGADVL